MKNIYKTRVVGSLLLAFVLGIIAKNNFTMELLTLVVVPVIALWFMSYDEAKYKKYEGEQS